MSVRKWFNNLAVLYQLPLIAAISYLLGSINTSIIVSKFALKKDIRDYGSGNAGFTNAVRSMGWKRGLIVLFGDVGKCALAILIGQLIYSGNMSFINGAEGRLIAGAFVFLGHIYPLFFRFRGGKGVLTFGTTIAMFDWRIFLIAFAVFLIVSFTTKYVSLASICGSLVVPVMVLLFSKTSISDIDMSLGYTAVAAFMSFIVIFKHRTNIARLIKGEESKFSFRGRALMDSDKSQSADSE
jgi:glycerol-3-phosphate acyltransferase PlsY